MLESYIWARSVATLLLLLLIPLPAPAFVTKTRSQHERRQLYLPTTSGHLSASESSNNGEETTTWNGGTVVSSKSACPSGKSLLWKIQIDDPKIIIDYTTPGQFLQLRKDDTTDPLFLAMCSPPASDDDDANVLEFLVKTTPNIPWLADIKDGETVQVSSVMGEGFAAAAAALQDNDKSADDGIDHILLVGAGSGISPLMAAFRNQGWLDSVTYGSVYYGEWTFDDICFQDELTTEESGINLVPCFSKQERDFTKGLWSGHVQTVMWQRGITNPEKTLACVCGMKDMVDDVRQLLKRAGVKPERIVTNV